MIGWLISAAYVLGGLYVVMGLLVGGLPVVGMAESGKAYPTWQWGLALFWPMSSVLFVLVLVINSVHSGLGY
jgi:hypothetical protein